MRRREPRRLAVALERTTRQTRPLTALARLREVWPAVAGAAVAREAEPVREHEGVVTVACRSSVWAQELELLGPDLARRLEAALDGAGGELRLRRLRFVTSSLEEPS